MPEILERHLPDDGDRRRVQRLGHLRAGDRRPDDDAAILVDDEPRGARRTAPDERASRVAARLDVDRAHREARLFGGGEREPDRADLRVGEDHPRRGAAVRAEMHLLAENRVGGESRLVLPHVRQERAAVDVADRVEPRLVPGNAERLVDRDVLPRLEPDRVEPDVCAPRCAPDRDEDLVGLDRLTVVELDADDAVPRDSAHLGLDADVDPGLAEGRLHLLARERLLALDQPVSPMNERHPRTERRPGLRHLDPDHPASQDEEPARDLLGRRRLDIRPGTGLSETRHRRNRRGAPGRDHDGLSCDENLVADAYPPLPVEPSVAADERHPALVEPWQLGRVVEIVDDLVAPGEHGLHVEPAGRDAGNTLRLRCELAGP